MDERNRRRPTQPSELSPDQRKRLADGLRSGNHPATICNIYGVSPDVYGRWMGKGREAKWGQYAELYREMTAAEAEAERDAVDAWRDGFEKSWQASRDFLKLRFGDRWGGDDDDEREPLSIHLYLPVPDDDV